MTRELWDYDSHSHRVILNVGRRQRRDISIASNILNRPRLVVLVVMITMLIMLFLKEARSVLISGPHFEIQDIILENTNLITKDILKLKGDKGIFDVSTKEIVRMLEKDPDIDKAVVEKILPGTLKIIINERIPYARLDIKGKEYLIDRNGRVLLRERSGINIPTINGIKTREPFSRELYNILDVLSSGEDLGLGRFIEINKINFYSENFISLNTREHITIKLKLAAVSEQLDKLLFVLNDAQSKGRLLKEVDLRFRDVYVE